MEKNLRLLLVVFILQSVDLGAREGDDIATKMLHAGKQEAAQVLKEGRREARRVRRQLVEEEHEAKEAVKQRQEQLTQEALAEAQKILDEAQEEGLGVVQASYAQIERLKRHAMEAMDDIIDQAQQEALAVQAESRRQILEDFLEASEQREKEAWKEGLRAEFVEALKQVKDIVRQGEDAAHAPVILEHIKKQRAWFLSTLDRIQTSSDQRYFVLFQRLQALKNMVQSTRDVGRRLIKKAAERSIDLSDMHKIRLMALYDVQSVVSHKKRVDGVAVATFLTGRECDIIAESLSSKLLALQRGLEAKKANDQLRTHQEMLQNSLNVAKREQEQIKQSMERMRTEALAQGKAMADEVAKRVEQAAFAKLVPVLEGMNKENAQLQMIILDQNQTLERLKSTQPPTALAVTPTPPVPSALPVPAVQVPAPAPVVPPPAPAPLPVTTTPTQPQQPSLTVEEREAQSRVALEAELQNWHPAPGS